MCWKIDEQKLLVYIEGRKRRELVGHLEVLAPCDFVFTYEQKYLRNPTSISLGPDIPLSKITHESQGKLFPSFEDRIPSRKNPAYKDYCVQQGISPDEKNPIILLGTIGRRGPSSFIFESHMVDTFNVQEALANFRKNLNLTYHDVALAFDMTVLTLQRVEKGICKDSNILSLIKIYLTKPEILKNLLNKTRAGLHHDSLNKIWKWTDESR